MTQLQRTFKESYLLELKDAVKANTAVSLYGKPTFNIDETKTARLANVYEPDGLAERLDPLNDFKSAVALYEAYKDISPLVATSEAFWAYLTHTSLFNYTQKRWPDVFMQTTMPSYVLDHWFISGQGILRNAAAALWWGAYLTVDDSRENKYELTEILFSNYSFRINTFGGSLLIRHREAMIGVLGFLRDNIDIFKGQLEYRGRFIARYFNRLGAVKQLASLDREFFRTECERIKDTLLKINSRSDLDKVY